MIKRIKPSHPGELLLRDYLKPLGITPYRLAKDIGVSQSRVSDIVHGQRSISTETSLLLGRYLRMSDAFWSNMQKRYDLMIAKKKMQKELLRIKPIPLDRVG